MALSGKTLRIRANSRITKARNSVRSFSTGNPKRSTDSDGPPHSRCTMWAEQPHGARRRRSSNTTRRLSDERFTFNRRSGSSNSALVLLFGSSCRRRISRSAGSLEYRGWLLPQTAENDPGGLRGRSFFRYELARIALQRAEVAGTTETRIDTHHQVERRFHVDLSDRRNRARVLISRQASLSTTKDAYGRGRQTVDPLGQGRHPESHGPFRASRLSRGCRYEVAHAGRAHDVGRFV